MRAAFDVDEPNSQDRAAILGSDKVGYRSIHFVCSLGSKRAELPEYKGLADLKFEIQVRTVLQHAWAELAHDNTFKFDAVLPTELQRKLNLHSAMLEIVDTAFQEIFDEAREYRRSLASKSIDQISEEEIDSISVERVVSGVAKSMGLSLIKAFGSIDSKAISELGQFGIANVGQLESLFGENFKKYYTKDPSETPIGLLRSAMMLQDVDKYFSMEFGWSVMDKATYDNLSKKYGSEKIDAILLAQDLDIETDDDEADEEFDSEDFIDQEEEPDDFT